MPRVLGSRCYPGAMPVPDAVAAPPEDPHLRDCLAQHRAAAAAVDAVFSAHSADQLRFVPGRGRWSILGNVEHLVRVGREQAAAVAEVIERGRREGRRRRGAFRAAGWERWFIALVEPPYRLRMPTLRRYVADGDLDPGDVRRRFGVLQDELAALIAAADGLDLDGLRGPLPYLSLWNPSLSLGHWFVYIAAHERRHLAQIERIRRDPALPR